MKNLFLYLVLFIFAISFTSCDKTEDEITPDLEEITSTCKIDKVTRTEKGNVNILTYHYEGEKITKITERSDGGSEDHSITEVTYNTDGTYQKIEEFSDWGQGYQLRRLYEYTYNSDGNISIVDEARYDYADAYNSVTNFTYANGKVVSIISTGSDKMKVTDITYENGNMKNAKLDFEGDGEIVIDIIVKCDDKFNFAKHNLPNEDMLNSHNVNNVLTVETINAFDMPNEDGGTTNVPAGSKIVDVTLTYNSDGEVSKMITHPSIFDGDNNEDRTKDITYICD